MLLPRALVALSLLLIPACASGDAQPSAAAVGDQPTPVVSVDVCAQVECGAEPRFAEPPPRWEFLTGARVDRDTTIQVFPVVDEGQLRVTWVCETELGTVEQLGFRLFEVTDESGGASEVDRWDATQASDSHFSRVLPGQYLIDVTLLGDTDCHIAVDRQLPAAE